MTLRLKELQEKCDKLQIQIRNSDLNLIKLTPEYNEKLLLLHGLPKPIGKLKIPNSSITNVFYDVVNIDLSGYIGDISRIRRNGSQRSLKI